MTMTMAIGQYSISQIGFDHLRIVLNLLWQAERDRFAVIDNLDSLANAHHHFHVVFDQQNRQIQSDRGSA